MARPVVEPWNKDYLLRTPVLGRKGPTLILLSGSDLGGSSLERVLPQQILRMWPLEVSTNTQFAEGFLLKEDLSGTAPWLPSGKEEPTV